MRFGYFDDKNREYVITTPKTPYPWINYLGSESFFSLISHRSGGYCFYRDARFRRLLRYRYNNVPTDVGGRYFYINDGGDRSTDILGDPVPRDRSYLTWEHRQTYGEHFTFDGEFNYWSDSEILREALNCTNVECVGAADVYAVSGDNETLCGTVLATTRNFQIKPEKTAA